MQVQPRPRFLYNWFICQLLVCTTPGTHLLAAVFTLDLINLVSQAAQDLAAADLPTQQNTTK
jgi:hypothetical protein